MRKYTVSTEIQHSHGRKRKMIAVFGPYREVKEEKTVKIVAMWC